MQHLPLRAAWDHDGVREDLRGYVVEHLGCDDAVLVVDETGDDLGQLRNSLQQRPSPMSDASPRPYQVEKRLPFKPHGLIVRISPRLMTLVPLTGQLSNRQFGRKLDDLLAKVGSSQHEDLGSGVTGAPRPCRCACGQSVTGSRKFVNQDHHSRTHDGAHM